MSLKDQIAELETRLERVYEKSDKEIEGLKEENRTLREELQHFRAAVAAVKWLWDKAQSQTPFQL